MASSYTSILSSEKGGQLETFRNPFIREEDSPNPPACLHPVAPQPVMNHMVMATLSWKGDQESMDFVKGRGCQDRQ